MEDELLQELMAKIAKLQTSGSATSSSQVTGNTGALREMLEKVKKMEQEKKERIYLKRQFATDLLFIIDVTGSMKPYADAVKAQVRHIIKSIEEMFKFANKNRVGIVAYRDVQLSPRFELLPFTEMSEAGLSKIQDFLGGLKFTTDVRNDFVEDVHGALEKAASPELGWSSPTRTIVHIADAPGHGKRLYDNSHIWNDFDYFPNHDEDGAELQKLMHALREHIKVNKYYFVHIPDIYNRVHTRIMFKRLEAACGDPAMMVEVEWGGPEEMAFQVIEAVSESVKSSLSSAGGNLPQRDFELDPTVPDWDNIAAVEVKITQHDTAKVKSIDELVQMISKGAHFSTNAVTDGNAARLRVAPRPFAKGTNRLVYYGRYYPDGPGADHEEVVLKEFISNATLANKAVAYKAQMETQTVACMMAELFSEQAQQWHPDLHVPRVEFAQVELISIQEPKFRFLLMEPMLEGEMRKFNNNTGWLNLSDPQPHLQAFSHWTYEITGKTLMVTDVQGFRTFDDEDNLQIQLTDPAIHCVSKDHFSPFGGNTNFSGSNGFKMFLHSHRCSEVCNQLIPRCMEWRSKDKQEKENQARERPQDPEANAQRFRGFALHQRGRGRRGGSIRAGKNVGGRRYPAASRYRTLQRARTPGPNRPDTDAEGATAATTADVKRRVEDTKAALKAHDECMKLLRAKDIPVPRNLSSAIHLCVEKGLMTKDRAAELHGRRGRRNAAQHAW